MVRVAEIDDAPGIAGVHVHTWRTSYRGLLPLELLESLSEADYTERWARSIADATTRVWVAVDQTGIVGFASAGRERAGETGFTGELYAIYVLDRAQRQGFGRALMLAATGGLRELGFSDMLVWVLRNNADARAFYERLGGVYLRTQETLIGPAVVEEVGYGWRRLEDVRW